MKNIANKRGFLLALLIITFLLSFAIGRYPVPIGTLLKVILSKIFPIAKTWTDTIETIVFRVRLPRILAAILVGASLSLSGAVYQGMFRNPLVSPDILGVSAGAAFGAALAIFLSFNTVGIQISAFIFGILGVALVYLISIKIKEDPVISLVIIGILIGSIFTSFTSLIKYIADTEDKLPTITFWLMGSLSGISPKDVKRVFIPILLGIVPLYLLRWKLNVLSLDEDEAKTLGLDTGRLRIIVIICSTLMTAASVSISGIIGWIGLVIPHLGRIIVGPDYRVLVPTTLLLGSIYLLIIDNMARALTTVEIPLGILTSLIGAPFFIFLLLNKGRSWDK
ncbi:putative ABC transporter permease protein HI_1471 [[Clostridium] ultunense Esp]|uniref:Putative ABC transporter permease protein HI_1471 n=1 Tax=[Clostridium] ultunense Esp TaxID=1288971 RepID=M1YX02_9FIRM|nr:iron ABC transporter permease [Schnuerera ultunensis]CCQ95120.1 putative ABC transporter permease protein HI_1471 [[Clostridium] ultunense Esp]SHD78657.1 putative ABC transporter permease protein HI_1471 [[Clostridium] ultunense Esp]